MKHRSPRLRRADDSFTLVEVMVSVAILALMMASLLQMMDSAMSVSTGGFKHMDADTQARMVFDRMAIDFANITKRTDVDYYFQRNTTNDQMAFYSQSGGYYPAGITNTVPESTMSLVGYRINGNNQLERLSKALIWNGVTSATPGASSLGSSTGYSPMVFLPQTIAGTWPQVEGNGSDSNYQVIGDQVFRLEFCYLVENSGSATAVLSTLPYLAPDTTTNGFQDVVAVVVSIAVLDSESQVILNGANLQTAAAQIPDVTGATLAATNLPATTWQAQLQSNNLKLPQAAASQVRFYQRYFYVNHVP